VTHQTDFVLVILKEIRREAGETESTHYNFKLRDLKDSASPGTHGFKASRPLGEASKPQGQCSVRDQPETLIGMSECWEWAEGALAMFWSQSW
jgi:hypothetical protein